METLIKPVFELMECINTLCKIYGEPTAGVISQCSTNLHTVQRLAQFPPQIHTHTKTHTQLLLYSSLGAYVILCFIIATNLFIKTFEKF